LQLQGSKSQPKLTHFWNKVLGDQKNTKQLNSGGTPKPKHLHGPPKRVKTKNNNNSEPIVITIDDDQDEIMASENVAEPLVVLEVVRLGDCQDCQSSKTSGSSILYLLQCKLLANLI
jgi:hypothetical protein